MNAAARRADPARVGYVSTRAAGAAPVSFEEALLAGPAKDGGLYVPTELPGPPPRWLEAESLADLARLVLPPFVGEEGAAAVAAGLDFDVPVTRPGGSYLLELFHGPTAAFKDVGARSLARLMRLALSRRGERATILVATSGDTGGAVADAFAGLEGLQVALLYPRLGVSSVQEEQLTARRPHVRAFAVDGRFDDCLRLARGAFTDPALAGLGLTSANSINVGRLLPQALYHLLGMSLMWRELGAGTPLRVVVPSGNLGNLTAGLLARELVGGTAAADVSFVAAHNVNDFFPRFLAGEAGAEERPPSVATLSNAMDVGAPSNFERLRWRFGPRLPELVRGVSVSDEATLRRMRLTYEEHGYLACPHTAVGLEADARLPAGEGRATLVLATAHPAKFPDTVLRATGVSVEAPPSLKAFGALPKRSEPLTATHEALAAALLAEPEFSA